MNLRFAFLVCLAAATCGSTIQAQEPVVGVDNPEPLFHDKDPKLDANKQVVLHIMRDLLEANHWSDAPKWIAPEYHQHNPLVQSGLDPVMKFFGSRTPSPIPDTKDMKTKIVAVLAEGDLVMVAIRRELPEPSDPNRHYTSTWFDMWRVQNGKAVEHWDAATKPASPQAGGKKED
jgi:predicted SnoaL-like aldol condensation-catalyzing enzyme